MENLDPFNIRPDPKPWIWYFFDIIKGGQENVLNSEMVE